MRYSIAKDWCPGHKRYWWKETRYELNENKGLLMNSIRNKIDIESCNLEGHYNYPNHINITAEKLKSEWKQQRLEILTLIDKSKFKSIYFRWFS